MLETPPGWLHHHIEKALGFTMALPPGENLPESLVIELSLHRFDRPIAASHQTWGAYSDMVLPFIHPILWMVQELVSNDIGLLQLPSSL